MVFSPPSMADDSASGGLAHLWAGWRSDYIAGANATSRTEVSSHTPEGCTFCRIFASSLSHAETFVVESGKRCVAILNLYPYTSGHMMVIPRAHVANIGDLNADESNDLWAMINQADAAVRRAFRPEGVNIGINQGRAAGAGIPAHLHVHVVPRWSADTNFMTAVADTRIIPESLDETYRRLMAAWGTVA